MKVIIVGIGKFGKKVLQFLSKEGHDVVVVDKDENKIQTIVDRYDVFGVCGSGVIAENLEEAGAKNADLLIAVTPSDEINLLCCLMAKSLGTKNTIARVRDPEYNDQSDFMRDRFGIDKVLNPEKALAEEITRILRFPAAEKIHSFADGKAEIIEMKLTADSPLVGKTLCEIGREYKNFSVLISVIDRAGEIVIPNGDTKLLSGDVINVCAQHTDLCEFLKEQRLLKKKVQQVMILGADRMSYYLAKNLVKYGIPVKVISPYKDRCGTISLSISRAFVVCGDFSDRDFLESEGFADAGAVVTMTEHDENNIMISLFAKEKMIKKTVTVLRNESYQGIIDTLSLDTVISPYQVVAEDTLRYLRSLSSGNGGKIEALYKLAHEKAEAIQFNVEGHTAFVGKAVKEIKIKAGILISAIIREKSLIIPNGDTKIFDGDSMIIVYKSDKIVSSIDDILR